MSVQKQRIRFSIFSDNRDVYDDAKDKNAFIITALRSWHRNNCPADAVFTGKIFTDTSAWVSGDLLSSVGNQKDKGISPTMQANYAIAYYANDR